MFSPQKKLNPHKKMFLWTIILIVVIIIIWSCSFLIPNLLSFSHKQEVNSSIYINEIKKICELSTVKYSYSSVVISKDSITSELLKKQFGKSGEIPFTEKKFILKYDAHLKAGVEFSDLKVTGENSCKVVLIPKIFENVTDNTEIYDSQDTIFNKLKLTDDDAAIKIDKKNFETAHSSEIFQNAKLYASEIITSIMKSAGYTTVDIEFIQDKPNN